MKTFSPSTGTQLARFIRGEGSVPKWLQWLFWLSLAPAVGKLVALEGFVVALGIIVVVVAVPVGVSALWKTEIGIYIMLLLAFFISIPNRLLNGVPMGILLDVVILVMMVGLLYKSTYKKDWSTFTSPMSISILLWAAMNLIELFNPFAASRAAWFFVIRPAVGYLLLFFLTYSMLTTPRKLYRLLFAILGLSLFSAGWGIWQANFGYFAWEYNYVVSHDVVHLVFNYGRWRAIGSIGSPAQFGILMGFISMLSLALLTAFKGLFTRLFLLVTFFATLMGMVYSGTRSAYVIIPIFYFCWIILSKNKKLYYSLIFATGLMVVVAVMPTNNYHIQRIQSTFKASEDASYQTRARNKKIIFPWILTHPIGGGLGSTGVWGQRFSPGTFLANFPPDSGLIRVAVELGWIGLFFFLNVYYNILVKGTFLFWKMKNARYKAIVSGMICAIAPLLVVEWGQEVVGVFPMSVLFWLFAAIMFRSIDFDRKEQLASGTFDQEIKKVIQANGLLQKQNLVAAQ